MNKAIAIAGLIGATLLGAQARADEASRDQPRDVPHLCGGIGVEGREALRTHAHEYNLGVMLDRAADGSHVYLSNVRLTVSRGDQDLASFVADGPICYVKVPPGRYTVKGSWKGEERATEVGTGTMDAQLRW